MQILRKSPSQNPPLSAWGAWKGVIRISPSCPRGLSWVRDLGFGCWARGYGEWADRPRLFSPEAVKELRRATDLALRATKHTACAVGRSMAGSVAAERHLWLNLTEIREKEKVFLLDAPISQSGLFGEPVSSIVENFCSAKTQSAALKQFMPRRTRDHFTPSSSLSREQSLPRKEPSGRSGAQAVHPPPTTVWGARGRPFPRQRPHRGVDLKRPNRPAASAPPSRSWPSSWMRRAASPPQGETRPQKRICPPQTRSPHSDLSQPPLEVWCAERVHPHFSSVWQLGDAFVFPPSTVRHFPTSGPRVRGHSRFSPTACGPRACHLSVQHFTLHQPKDAEGFPSWWSVTASRPSRHPNSGMSSFARHSASSIAFHSRMGASTSGIALGFPHISVRLHTSVWEKSRNSDSTMQSKGEQCPSPSHSPILALPDLVLGANSPLVSVSLGDSDQAGLAVPASGQDLASSTRALEVVGMAHTGPRALMNNLPVEVQETIASARAPATRKLYSSKRRLWVLVFGSCNRPS